MHKGGTAPVRHWEVIVGNIGRVFEGANGFHARQVYGEYVGLSKAGYGRAGHENVTLWRNGEIYLEHHPNEDETGYWPTKEATNA